MPVIFRVFLDANVLFPASIRNTLLDAHKQRLVQVYWSQQVLEELRRNLVLKQRKSEDDASTLVNAMCRIFPESVVSGYEAQIASMRNDEGDRHVTAAALTAGAQVIVTNNLKHFRAKDLPPGIEAQPADFFLQQLLDLDPETMVAILQKQVERYREPLITFEAFLEHFSRSAPGFIRDVREYLLALN
ncbi:PIN domain-containing protein [Corallococcus terminator]|uniref:PIN domain-containing protein n=1 Tax=Corallococcus terminator TaxID=2316733 RepID=UPI0013156B54|nr:PIN domain-containing protein [Corallococcus terminator]